MQRCLGPHCHPPTPLETPNCPWGWLGMCFTKLLCLLKMKAVACSPSGLVGLL